MDKIYKYTFSNSVAWWNPLSNEDRDAYATLL